MIRVGPKYQHLVCNPQCGCVGGGDWAPILNRRGFFAAAAVPVAATAAATLVAGPAIAQTTPAKTGVAEALRLKAAELIDADKSRLVEMYKDIHQNPEVGFHETRTAAIVAKQLQDLGFEVKTGIGKTGVVGVLKNGDGPTVMYRADMDCNVVEELVDLPYASKKKFKGEDGKEMPLAHMCGHDAHVTWMMGVAKAMVAMKSAWKGTLVCVGQPAEEPITGAQAMIDDGMYSKHGTPKPSRLIALHTAPVPTGVVACKAGTVMAGTDQIDVTFKGVGGHGSMPQLTKDPVIMAAMAITQYQVIVSRVVAPLDPVVITVGSVQAGNDNNVIPGSALLKVNLRFFDLKVRQQIIDAIKQINNGIATTYGMPADQMPTMVMKGHSPPLVNDAKLVDVVLTSLRPLVGDKQVVDEFPPATGSEDAHLLKGDFKDVEMAYMAVGIAEPKLFEDAVKVGKGMPFSAHNGNFRVDLDAIPLGAKIGTVATLSAFLG